MKNFFTNYLSTIAFILIAYIFYSEVPYYQGFLIKEISLHFADFSINTKTIFHFIIVTYFITLIPFYIKYKEKSKARIVIESISKKFESLNYKINKIEKTALLSWIVKLFFAPLMIFWLADHSFTLLNNIYFSYGDINLISKDFLLFFNKHFFWLCFTAILFFDVFFFTSGYLLESTGLKNKIKSVEPTLLGWGVAIIAYPPFNGFLTDIIGWYSTDFPQFGNPTLHLILNFSIIILMSIYSWASISLGFKASNLTNRGIVTKGPYRFVRHPAYICKNLAWFIGGLPLIIGNIMTGQIKDLFIVLFSLLAWSLIYYMRAITEENHLRKDKDYLEYSKKVKYKFIPKVW